MAELKWPIPDHSEVGKKLEYRAWFADGYYTARGGPYTRIPNAIYGDEGAINLFEKNVNRFKKRGPCTLFAVAIKDHAEILILPDDGFVYLADREAIGKRERNAGRYRQACGAERMTLDEYRQYTGADPHLKKVQTVNAPDTPSNEATTTVPIASDINPPERVQVVVYRILRDTALALRIKQIHNWECQICGHFIVFPDGSRYAEAHHIQPLGKPHDGNDVESNVVCVCPNHHAELDYGVRQVDLGILRQREGHKIDEAVVKYHNEQIFGRVRKTASPV